MSFRLLFLRTEFVAKQYPGITLLLPSLSRFSRCLNGRDSESVRSSLEDDRGGAQAAVEPLSADHPPTPTPRSPFLLECQCHGALLVHQFVPTMPGIPSPRPPCLRGCWRRPQGQVFPRASLEVKANSSAEDLDFRHAFTDTRLLLFCRRIVCI